MEAISDFVLDEPIEGFGDIEQDDSNLAILPGNDPTTYSQDATA